jgi:hypothetical protein
MRIQSFLAILLLSVTGPAANSQQVDCQGKGSVKECLNDFAFDRNAALALGQKIKATEVKKGAEEEAQEKNQAGASAAGSQARSTFTDLLPWFDALGMLSDADASDGTVALDLNFLLPVQKKEDVNRNSQLRWQFDIKPEPFEPLIEALPESVREARKKELQGKIKDTADSELQYTYSVVNEKLGRDFRRQSSRLTALLAPAFVAATEGEVDDAVTEGRRRLVLETDAILGELRALGMSGDSVLDAPLSSFSPQQMKLVNQFVTSTRDNLGVALAKKLTVIRDTAIDLKADALAQLVLLQPQLTLSANKRFRDELVGPEQFGFKITYERSFVSLNDFIEEAGKSCAPLKQYRASKGALTPVDSDACLKKLGEYMDRHAEEIGDEDRITGSLEYKKVDRWQFALPNDAIDLDRPKYDRIIGALGYGRAISRSNSEGKDRVDFEASYDSNLDADDSYKSRLVVTLTYTRRFRDMDLPISIVYANKSEFLEGVDKQLGLHFGLKFRALDK